MAVYDISFSLSTTQMTQTQMTTQIEDSDCEEPHQSYRWNHADFYRCSEAFHFDECGDVTSPL